VSPQSQSFAVCTALLRAAAPLAPADLRRDWLREWEAELWFTATQRKPHARPQAARLVTRCAGAWVHAAWLRWDRWRLEMLLQDIRYAVRTLVRKPGFATMTILIGSPYLCAAVKKRINCSLFATVSADGGRGAG